jgi:hypothetical protein
VEFHQIALAVQVIKNVSFVCVTSKSPPACDDFVSISVYFQPSD